MIQTEDISLWLVETLSDFVWFSSSKTETAETTEKETSLGTDQVLIKVENTLK